MVKSDIHTWIYPWIYPCVDISMDISMDIHIHGNPGYFLLVLIRPISRIHWQELTSK